MAKQYELVIDGELTDLNTYINAERTHRLKAAKLKQAETAKVFYACMQQLNGTMISKPVHIHINWYTKNNRKDPDNVAFAKKFILDGMVKAGFLPQDSRKWISELSDFFYTRKEHPRVEVLITEI